MDHEPPTLLDLPQPQYCLACGAETTLGLTDAGLCLACALGSTARDTERPPAYQHVDWAR